MIIGIMGKVGSGKSEVVKYIVKEYKALSFSADDIAKEMIQKGEIDYKIENPGDFFRSEHLQEQCRRIVHPKVFSRIFENINNSLKECRIGMNIFVIETALPNDDFLKKCNFTIYVTNSYEKKKEILAKNRNYSDIQTKLIYDSQSFYDNYYNKANYVIENDGSIDDLFKKVNEVMDEICVICK